MLSREENELLTRTDQGTPAGNYFRRFWLPAVLPSELPAPDCPPVRVRLLGEDLIAFRDSKGQVGLVEEACPHRRASLFWGRNEECGLRCVYHGWKFDVNGTCMDMPNEPRRERIQNKVRITAYPTREYGGMIWTYMGRLQSIFPSCPSSNGRAFRRATCMFRSACRRLTICKPSRAE